MPSVLLSTFADEGAVHKTALEQMTTLAALGLEYYSPRFVDVGGGIKNVMALTKAEVRTLQKLHRDYGVKVASIGSPLGKVKLRDVDDGTSNRYVPFDEYLKRDLATAIERANQFETRLIRGFSFYHPRGTDPRAALPEVVERLSAMTERCGAEGLIFGLEVEANLVGQDGHLLAEIHRQVASPHLVLVFDAANLTAQNMPAARVFDEYAAMRPGLGWMHIKDYRIDPRLEWTGVVDEERLKNFVPADEGSSGHEAILRDFREHIPVIERKLKKLGAPGVFLELEPHVKGGGQFGGYSGPDGLGVALRALCRLLDYVGIDYRLRDFQTIREARGF